jgi:outer membrane protein assembly factor BamB
LGRGTGKVVWRETRPDHRGWSTPILITANNRQELVLNGHEGVTAYEPATGKQLWFCKSFNGRGEPTATPGESMIYLVNGQPGDIYAVKPGGDGNVTASRMAWHTTRRSGRDLPSPILIGNFLLVSSMGGVCTCYDSTTGAVLWNDRLGGNYSASPIAANGLAYFQAEDGSVVVVRPGPTLDIVARNEIDSADDELFRGSLAPCEGQLFARSDKALYCLGKK